MLDRPLVCVDLETTGINPVRDRVTEVAVIAVQDGEVTREWSTLLNPETWIPEPIQALTGITNEMLAESPTFLEIAEPLSELLEGCLFIAHNARFDYGFLRNEFKRVGRQLQLPVLCTVKLSRKLFPEHRQHSLDSLIGRYGLDCEVRHRALGDARALWRFLQKLDELKAPGIVTAAVAELLRRPALPAGLSQRDLEEIPETPGVYLFYDGQNAPLYVGKSVNLRSRVLSHFSGDHRLNKDMRIAQQVRRVEWVETAGELGALLKEAQLVKNLLPVYNRALRRHSSLWSFQWGAAAVDDTIPRLIDAHTLDTGDLENLYGLYRTRRKALNAFRELVDDHGLCHKLTGLEKTTRGPCFSHQLKRCRGACVGAESPLQHRIRLMQALAPLKIQAWPFPGRVGIRERSPDGRRIDVHLLDHWCYLGTVKSDAQMDLFGFQERTAMFDVDTYRILQRFLARKGARLDVICDEELRAQGL
jgi:DNA polymerase-3 subunit epsilon